MEVKNLSYYHSKNSAPFFQDLTFFLEPGKIHALHGKNGVGKTVLLNILSKKSPPHSVTKGEIIGKEKSFLVDQRFDQMLADQFSFEENLKFACLDRFPKLFAGFKNPIIDFNFLKKFQLNPSLPVHKLSGGQRQILAVLMALQKSKTILLLDEPTATLDEQNSYMVFEFLRNLAEQNMTILTTCHDRKLINHFANGKHLCLEIDAAGIRKLKN